MFASTNKILCVAPTQSPSYAAETPNTSAPLPLAMDPVLAVVTNTTGQMVSE